MFFLIDKAAMASRLRQLPAGVGIFALVVVYLLATLIGVVILRRIRMAASSELHFAFSLLVLVFCIVGGYNLTREFFVSYFSLGGIAIHLILGFLLLTGVQLGGRWCGRRWRGRP